MNKPLDPEFKAQLDRFGKEALARAEAKGRNAILAAVKAIVRRTRMQDTTKAYLLNQIEALRDIKSGEPTS